MEQTSKEVLEKYLKSRGVGVTKEVFDVQKYCFKEQIAFIQDQARFKTAVCSRRAGKTVACAAHLIDHSISTPKRKSLYITLSRSNAKKIIWDYLLDINRTYRLGGITNETELSLKFPNQSQIYLSGANDKSEVDKFRGLGLSLCYLDECFHPDTLVETLAGPLPIKDIKLGDLVKNALGYGKVISRSVKIKDQFVLLKYNNQEIKCSLNHPFLTINGWVKAQDLKEGDQLATQRLSMRLLQGYLPKAKQESLQVLRECLLREVTKRDLQSYEQSKVQEKIIRDFKENRAQAEDQRRQWSWSDSSREDLTFDLPRYEMELCNWVRQKAAVLSSKLQGGLSRFISQTSGGDRWWESQSTEEESSGLKENREADFIRLDSIEIQESRSDRTNTDGCFYDLGVEGHPSFTVAGALVHNCQSFPAYIEDLVDQVIAKALFDYNGTLCLIGTPAPVPSGYFYKCANESNYSHHAWTMFQNPFLKDPTQLLQDELNRKGVTIDDPTIQRECFGAWVLDSNALVFRYSPELNHFESLPSPVGDMEHIIGIDVGYSDSDAIAVIGWDTKVKRSYLIDEFIRTKQTVTDLVSAIDRLYQKYPPLKIVMDTGGLGKKIAEEISRRYQIPIQPAEKARKNEYIELLNDSMRTGKFHAKKSSKFAQDCMIVEWDKDKTTPDKKVISDRYHSDICDAVLYAFRESLHWLSEADPIRPKPGMLEYEKILEDEYISKLERDVFEQKRYESELDSDLKEYL